MNLTDIDSYTRIQCLFEDSAKIQSFSLKKQDIIRINYAVFDESDGVLRLKIKNLEKICPCDRMIVKSVDGVRNMSQPGIKARSISVRSISQEKEKIRNNCKC